MTHIEQRGDTASGWTAANPTLNLNELGWETNTRKSKLGDGSTKWNDLPYTTAVVVVTKADVGLGEANNTSDMDKPISSANASALSLKAPKASPAFTGNPTAPTPSTSDNDTSIATTAFVKAAIAAALADPAFAEGIVGAAIEDALEAERLTQNPVGCIRHTTVDVNPSGYIGGTWVKYAQGRVLVGVDTAQTEFDTVEKLAGAKTKTIAVTNLPPHRHTIAHTHQPDDPASNFLVSKSGEALNRANGGNFNAFGTGVTGQPSTPNSGVGDGDSTPISLLQPSVAVFTWKRTA